MSFETFKTFNTFKTLALCAVLSCGVTGCLNESEDHHEHENAWDHPCIHAGQAATPVTAAADNALAPDVSAGHTHFGVTFAAGTRVKFVAAAHGEYGFFLTKNVPVTLLTASGDTVAFEETETNLTGCAELAVMHVADLDSGAHYLRFGTSAETAVGLVIEESEHHDH
jgi:hypothetical protein